MNELQLGKNVGYLVDTIEVCTRKQLAMAMGNSVQAVGQLISGASKGLKPVNLVAAADRLGVTERELVVMDMQAELFDPRKKKARTPQPKGDNPLLSTDPKTLKPLTKAQANLKTVINLLAGSISDAQANAIAEMIKASISEPESKAEPQTKTKLKH